MRMPLGCVAHRMKAGKKNRRKSLRRQFRHYDTTDEKSQTSQKIVAGRILGLNELRQSLWYCQLGAGIEGRLTRGSLRRARQH